MKRAIGVFVIAWMGVAATGSGDGVRIWTNQDLSTLIKSLSGTGKPSESKTIGDFGDHSVMVVHREADGQVEVHAEKHDVIIVRDGSGTLVTGGSVIGGKQSAPDEIRGERIENGNSARLHTGDVIYIPAKVPHQVLLGKGETITYEAVKIEAR